MNNFIGGAIERWEDKTFRTCFADILSGNWKQHDPYDLEGRINARSSMYGRENQSSIFRTYQGWLALRCVHPTRFLTNRIFTSIYFQRDSTPRRYAQGIPRRTSVERVYNSSSILPRQGGDRRRREALGSQQLGIWSALFFVIAPFTRPTFLQIFRALTSLVFTQLAVASLVQDRILKPTLT